MGTKLEEMQSGCFHKALPNEPMFILLARDPSAPEMVRKWAYRRASEIRQGKRPASDQEQVNEALATADKMEAWRAEHDGEWRTGLFADDTDKCPGSTRNCASPPTCARRNHCQRAFETGPLGPPDDCDKSPDGWICTRPVGHDGPCACLRK